MLKLYNTLRQHGQNLLIKSNGSEVPVLMTGSMATLLPDLA